MKIMNMFGLILLSFPLLASAKSEYDTNGVGNVYLRVPNCVLIEDIHFGPENSKGLALLQARCADIDDLKAGAMGLIENFPVYVVDYFSGLKSSGYTRPERAKFKSNNPSHKAGAIYFIDARLQSGVRGSSLLKSFQYLENEDISYYYNIKVHRLQKDYTFEEYVKAYPLSLNDNKLQHYLSKRPPTEGVEKAKAFARKRMGLS